MLLPNAISSHDARPNRNRTPSKDATKTHLGLTS